VSTAAATGYTLPSALIGRADLARLIREVESVDNELAAQKVRNKDNQESLHMPTMSKGLRDFIDLNKINFIDSQTRMTVKEQLSSMKDHAPVVHMTFAVDADPDFLQQLITWIRKEIHPQALISVGLQPAIVGGVYIRTPNHVHDFTIKALLEGKRDVIMNELEGLMHAR
jgi:F0F1-type ATP synthase delta subunit